MEKGASISFFSEARKESKVVAQPQSSLLVLASLHKVPTLAEADDNRIPPIHLNP